jgi:hypothetical protein
MLVCQGIWNLIFTLSNLSLFLFLPFAYLLCESEGFIGAKVKIILHLVIYLYIIQMPLGFGTSELDTGVLVRLKLHHFY